MANAITPALPILPEGTTDVGIYNDTRSAQRHQQVITSLFQVETQICLLPQLFTKRYALVVPVESDVSAIRRALFARGGAR